MDAAIMDPELMEGFFLDVDETFSPEVSRAMALARDGELKGSVDMMLRPLHTIKGTAAFLGLEEISAYAHAVEDHLKALQAGEAAPDADFMLRCVDMVFNLLERARTGDSLDGAGHKELVAAIRGGGPAQKHGVDGLFELQQQEGVAVLRVLAKRIHLAHQYGPVLQALTDLPEGSTALLDLDGVRTINSTTWGGLWLAAQRLELHVASLSDACQSTFASWGFAARITPHASAEAFWLGRNRE